MRKQDDMSVVSGKGECRALVGELLLVQESAAVIVEAQAIFPIAFHQFHDTHWLTVSDRYEETMGDGIRGIARDANDQYIFVTADDGAQAV